MYEFGVLMLGALLTAKTVDFVGHVYKDLSAAGKLVLAAVAGTAYAYLFDFSLFAGWGVSVSSDTVGTVGTGLFMMGLAGFWHELLGLMREWAHRYHGEASEIEARIRRAA